MYQPLSEASSTDRHNGSHEEGEKFYVPKTHTGSTNSRRLIHALFLLSIVANFALPIYFLHTPKEIGNLEKSRFAGLTRNIPMPWTSFNIANDTEQEKLWDKTNYDKGNIALDDGYARAMGLPRAQRFPWDKSKGIYLINAYHNLHCVKTLRTGIVEFYSIELTVLIIPSSLAAAIVRLIIETEIMNGGYAAHTDVDLTLTNLLYWSMIESGLALIAACLPTLHYFIARSSIRVGSIRSLLHLDSLRSRFSSRSTRTGGPSSYSEITVVKAFELSSNRDNEEVLDHIHSAGTRGDSEISMVIMKPEDVHAKV